MSIFKNVTSILSVSVLALGIAACDKKDDSATQPEPAPKTAQPAPAPQPAPEPAPEADNGARLDVQVGIEGGTHEKPKAGISVGAKLEGEVKSE